MPFLLALLGIGLIVCAKAAPKQTINQWSSGDPTCMISECRIPNGSGVDAADACLAAAPNDCQYTGNYNVSGLEDKPSNFCSVTFNGLGYWSFPLSQLFVPYYLSTTDSGRGWVSLTVTPTLEDGCTYTFSEVRDFGNATTCGIPESGPTTDFTTTLSKNDGVLKFNFQTISKYLTSQYGGLVTNKNPTDCGMAVNSVYMDLVGYSVYATGRGLARSPSDSVNSSFMGNLGLSVFISLWPHFL
eukprot:Gregarina_sp_Poly_1__10499@NODE_76_length_15862_cov_98_864577_g65_i0_p10_GENE_NODE_76_length_15862_cov_98_864577_g65_i0NODE_76_length_15862_cov_98_864577_g65_i0_p10_ORF_typecomplete_len243_score17_57_NODE_76_length_15862_cov_98_864577_g65_i01411914847